MSVSYTHLDVYKRQIRDTGIGIEPQFLEHLFDPFARSSQVGQIEGTGLGLSITRGLIELMNGSLQVESQVGQGSTFVIELALSLIHIFLKLDMKFIQNETAKPTNQGILRFIMSLARWMNLSVVAEGVETREQLERLRETGCDYVQGYYLSLIHI